MRIENRRSASYADLNIVRHAVRLGLNSMRDPRVMALHYTAVIIESTDYDRAPSLEFEVLDFSLKLDKGHLVCSPKVHFSSAEEARAVIEEFLHAWEADIALRYGKEELHFRFMRADMIDRDPPPPDLTNNRSGAVTLTGGGGITCRGHVSRGEYPDPPRIFRLTPEADTLYKRYNNYKKGCEPLQAMAYACLTLLERNAVNRRTIAKRYNIDEDVFRKIGEISSTRGDNLTARKFDKRGIERQLSHGEAIWVEAAIKALIRQVGETHSNTVPQKLKMSDLPPI